MGEWSDRLMHYRQMFDNEYLGAWDLPKGRDAVVTIEKVEAKGIKSQRGTDRKPVLHFKGKQKTLICNKTNCKAIAGMYGPDTTEWIGKQIALYASTTQAQGEEVECVRVRPRPPAASAKQEPADEPGSDR